MAVSFTGNAPRISQVTDYLFGGTWEASDLITATFGTKTVTFTAGATSITAIIDAIVEAWNLLTNTSYPEFAEVTASRSSNSLRLTMDTAGKPFTCTLATADAGGVADLQTIDGSTSSTGTNSTANSGPNCWNVAANWSAGAVPVNSDDVVIENTSTPIYYELSQTSLDLASLTIRNYRGSIGLPDYNVDGAPYYEYREPTLKLGTATVLLVDAPDAGPLRIHTGTNACTATVRGTGQPTDTGLPGLLLQGSHSSNALNITQGNVGLAIGAGTTAQFPVIRVGSEGQQASDATLVCGPGCTLGAISQAGGNVTVESNVTTWTKTAGSTSTILGSATITTITQDGQGTHINRSVGTIGTANFRGKGAVHDCSQDLRAKTQTNGTYTGGAALIDPNKTLTFTNPITTDMDSVRESVLAGAPFSLQRT